MTWFAHLERGVIDDELQHAVAFTEIATEKKPTRLIGSPGDAITQALRAYLAMCERELEFIPVEPVAQTTPFSTVAELYQASEQDFTGPAVHPLLATADGRVVDNRPLPIARWIAGDSGVGGRSEDMLDLVQRTRELGLTDDQATYEARYASLAQRVRAIEAELSTTRYLEDDGPGFSDLLLFAWAIRLDAVYYELYKANFALLRDLPNLQGFARDVYEHPAAFDSTDWDAIGRHYYRTHPILNAKGVVPRGGEPELHRPHLRQRLDEGHDTTGAVEEDPDAARVAGEWVRGQSRHRRWIGSDEYPAEPGRYHIYAPYNCPWSHRALLVRAMKGLDELVGASVVYFRRDPEHGWQFNPSIPGCDRDPLYNLRYLETLYEKVGSKERSAPVLWDAETETIVSNESADIVRMLNDAFGAQAGHAELDLYPEAKRDRIDEVNELVYQRINNGAYKAGFTSSQTAYERAFDRYFAALDWLEELLADGRTFLVETEHPTEADLRLFPTIFRHDAVYYARFKLNRHRISDTVFLQAWLDRMLAWPGIATASSLDHARNGYFGRTGNEIVPAGPVPLGLSPANFSRAAWLNSIG